MLSIIFIIDLKNSLFSFLRTLKPSYPKVCRPQFVQIMIDCDRL